MFKNRNTILAPLIVLFGLLFPIVCDAQLREQLYHNNVISEHYHPSVSAKDYLSVFVFHRTQWTGLSSAPVSTGLGVNYALFPQLSAQLYYVGDELQGINNQSFKLGLTYGLGLEKNLRISLRFSLNALSQKSDFNPVDPIDLDEILSQAGQSATTADADFSVAYGRRNWLLAGSVNNLLQSGFRDFGVNNRQLLSFYGENLWNFRLFRTLRLKSFVHYKSELQAIGSGVFELSNLFKLNPKLAFGAGYRFSESVPLLLQYQGVVSDVPFIFQYSYAIQTGTLSNFNTGSHEVSLRFNLRRLGSKIKDADDLQNEDREGKTKNVRFL